MATDIVTVDGVKYDVEIERSKESSNAQEGACLACGTREPEVATERTEVTILAISRQDTGEDVPLESDVATEIANKVRATHYNVTCAQCLGK